MAPVAWLGFLIPVIIIVLYFGSIALVLWIGYRIVRAAVKNGILDADVERERRTYLTTPPGWYKRDEDGKRAYWDGQDWTGDTVE